MMLHPLVLYSGRVRKQRTTRKSTHSGSRKSLLPIKRYKHIIIIIVSNRMH